jgi:hypothetical protein
MRMRENYSGVSMRKSAAIMLRKMLKVGRRRGAAFPM